MNTLENEEEEVSIISIFDLLIKIINTIQPEIERDMENIQINDFFPQLDKFLNTQKPFTKERLSDKKQSSELLYPSMYFFIYKFK